VEDKTPASVVLAIVFGIGFGVCLAAAGVLAFFYFKKNGKAAKVEEKPAAQSTPVEEAVEEEATEETKVNEDVTDTTSESDE
jgi:flagellar basal body-associated protein FliL